MDLELFPVRSLSGPSSYHHVMGDEQEAPTKTLSLGAISCLLQPPGASGSDLLGGALAGVWKAWLQKARDDVSWTFPSSRRRLHSSSQQEGQREAVVIQGNLTRNDHWCGPLKSGNCGRWLLLSLPL